MKAKLVNGPHGPTVQVDGVIIATCPPFMDGNTCPQFAALNAKLIVEALNAYIRPVTILFTGTCWKILADNEVICHVAPLADELIRVCNREHWSVQNKTILTPGLAAQFLF